MARFPTASYRPHLEQLEDRLTPAGTVSFNPYSGMITLDGTAGADVAQLSVSGGYVRADLSFGDTSITRYYPSEDVTNAVFHGFEGNDEFYNDIWIRSIAYGGAGHDYLRGGRNYDRLYGGSGIDTLIGNDAADHLYGQSGDDRLVGGDGNDWLYGGADDDVLDGGAGSDLVEPDRTGVGAWVNITEETVIASNISALERDLITHTNIERERRGLRLLRVSNRLIKASQYHAHNMAIQDQMAHTLYGTAYPDLYNRMRYADYDYRTAGENLAYNYDMADDVVGAWLNSPAHREALLDPDFTEAGAGVRWSSDGNAYYCMVFAQPA